MDVSATAAVWCLAHHPPYRLDTKLSLDELPRTPLPRTRVHKGKKKGRADTGLGKRRDRYGSYTLVLCFATPRSPCVLCIRTSLCIGPGLCRISDINLREHPTPEIRRLCRCPGSIGFFYGGAIKEVFLFVLHATNFPTSSKCARRRQV